MLLAIPKKLNKILVVSPIYNKIDKLEKIISLSNNYDLTILNGNICYPYDETANERIKIIDNLLKEERIIYVVGDMDYKVMLNNEKVRDWIEDKPNVVKVTFKRGTNILITCGGVLPYMNAENISNNIEVSFVNYINGKPWHLKYGGRLDYVISNNPVSSKDPEFFNYSARIGSEYGENVKIYGQVANGNGLQETILF